MNDKYIFCNENLALTKTPNAEKIIKKALFSLEKVYSAGVPMT